MCDRWHNRSLQSLRVPEVEEVKCIFCGGKTAKVSPRVRAGGEKVKRYQCKECGRYFQDTYITGDYYITKNKENEYTVVTI
jgi:hypothetical protein